ncbi:MAG: hypothetical protein WBS22_12680 [Methylocystis sp.]
MSVFLKRTAITLACATAVGALTSAPSLGGVITPTDKTAVSTGSPIDSVYYGWCHHRRHHYWRGCHASWNYPYYSYTYPYGPYASAGWGPGWGGWGAGWGGGGGLFGLGLL